MSLVLALVHEYEKDYQKALENFESYVNLTKNNSDYFTEVALDKITELKKLIKNNDYSKISELVNKIKNLLLFEAPCVTHYTGISVAKLLILDSSKLRLSEGAFLNDTSEDRELFKFLPLLTDSITSNDTVALPFTPKPFIGSFVAETKHDDLTLWRMYGKENKEEAKGCAITLDRNLLIENLKVHCQVMINRKVLRLIMKNLAFIVSLLNTRHKWVYLSHRAYFWASEFQKDTPNARCRA